MWDFLFLCAFPRPPLKGRPFVPRPPPRIVILSEAEGSDSDSGMNTKLT